MESKREEQAVEILLSLMEFYHEKLFKAEKQVFTGIQAAQFRLLYHLSAVSMISMSALGNMLYISKPYMTTLIDSLVAEGLVERNPDPQDRRVINISITEKGKDRLKSIRSDVQKQMKTVIAGLPESDLANLCIHGQNLLEIVTRIK